MAEKYPRITFGIIVLNGEPFTTYCLRSIYPYAHQILVVEGGSRHAAGLCTEDGHSTDRTIEKLRRFKAEEDPDNKLEIITREGFWEEKDQQSQAFAERATGDWLWQVDIDEFYLPGDMEKIIALMHPDNYMTMASFYPRTFWGSPEFTVDTYSLHTTGYQRLFRWGKGYHYWRHRPPTVLGPDGICLQDTPGWRQGRELLRKGIAMHHYSMLFPRQVMDKARYYTSLFGGNKDYHLLAERCYLKLEQPFRVFRDHQEISWLERYDGPHPPAVLDMLAAVERGEHDDLTLREMADAQKLLHRKSYLLGRGFLRLLIPLVNGWQKIWWNRPWWLRRDLYWRLTGKKGYSLPEAKGETKTDE